MLVWLKRFSRADLSDALAAATLASENLSPTCSCVIGPVTAWLMIAVRLQWQCLPPHTQRCLREDAEEEVGPDFLNLHLPTCLLQVPPPLMHAEVQHEDVEEALKGYLYTDGATNPRCQLRRRA
eukprot:3636206-Amphidinium_carterae.2